MYHNANRNHAGSGPTATWGLQGSPPQDYDDRPGELATASEQGRPEVVEDVGVEPTRAILQGSPARRRVPLGSPTRTRTWISRLTAGRCCRCTTGEETPFKWARKVDGD